MTAGRKFKMARYSMTIINYSSTEFRLNYWGHIMKEDVGSIEQSPDTILREESGYQTYSMSQILESVAVGPADLYFTWIGTSENHRIGVKLHVPYQGVGIGKAPYWFVSYDQIPNSEIEPNWIRPADDPSFAYNWPTSVGFTINATPIAGHTSLSITITITDLK